MVLGEQADGDQQTCDPRHEVVVEGRVDKVVDSKNHIKKLVEAAAVGPVHSYVLGSLTYFILQEDLFGL